MLAEEVSFPCLTWGFWMSTIGETDSIQDQGWLSQTIKWCDEGTMCPIGLCYNWYMWNNISNKDLNEYQLMRFLNFKTVFAKNNIIIIFILIIIIVISIKTIHCNNNRFVGIEERVGLLLGFVRMYIHESLLIVLYIWNTWKVTQWITSSAQKQWTDRQLPPCLQSVNKWAPAEHLASFFFFWNSERPQMAV